MDLTNFPYQPPFIVLIDNIYFLPIPWRKFILDSCRFQVPPSTNIHLNNSFDELDDTVLLYLEDSNKRPFTYHADKTTMRNLLEMVSGYYSYSILSYFARAERSAHVDEMQALKHQSLVKEFTAAVDSRIPSQTLVYSGSFITDDF